MAEPVDGAGKDYRPEEYAIDKNAEKATPAKDAKKEKDKEDTFKPFVAKDDYQVRQALNYIKSYQIFRATGVEMPAPATSVATPTSASGK
jgi:hypothetical protein